MSTTGGSSRPRYGGSGSGGPSRRSRSASLATSLGSRRSSGHPDSINRRLSGLAEIRRKSVLSVLGLGRKHLSDSEMAAAIAASSNIASTHDDRISDRAHLMEFEDPILARTVTVEETFRRMEVDKCIHQVYGSVWVNPSFIPHNTVGT